MLFKIITPEGIVISEDQATGVYTTASEGSIGILPHHMPLVATLEPTTVHYTTASGSENAFVSGGFLEVSNNEVSIITPVAEKADEIDFERAERARARAEEYLLKRENIDIARAESALARANARLSLRK